MTRFGFPREAFTDPRDALLEMHQRALGRVDLLTLIVRELEVEELAGVPMLTSVKEGERPAGQEGELVEYWETVETVGVSVWLKLLDEAEDRVARLAAEITKLGLLQRAIEIEQAQAALLGRAVTRTLDDLGLSSEQRLEAQRVLAGHLRELDEEASRHPPGVGRQGYG